MQSLVGRYSITCHVALLSASLILLFPASLIPSFHYSFFSSSAELYLRSFVFLPPLCLHGRFRPFLAPYSSFLRWGYTVLTCSCLINMCRTVFSVRRRSSLSSLSCFFLSSYVPKTVDPPLLIRLGAWVCITVFWRHTLVSLSFRQGISDPPGSTNLFDFVV